MCNDMKTKLILGKSVKYDLIESVDKSINQKLWGLIWNTVSWSIYFSLNRVLRIKIDELTIWETELD